jgi:hypothetical protein
MMSIFVSRRDLADSGAAANSGAKSQCVGRQPATGRVLIRYLLWFGLYSSMTSIVLMADELVRMPFADPDECEGAVMMIAVMLVIGFMCHLGLRPQTARQS